MLEAVSKSGAVALSDDVSLLETQDALRTSLSTDDAVSPPDARMLPTKKPERILWFYLAAIAAVALGGIAIALWIRTKPTGHPDPANWFNVFYVLFARNEPAGLILVLAFAALLAFWLGRGCPAFSRVWAPRPQFATVVLALLVFLLATAGSSLVFHQHALTADEHMADFQAKIFLSGKIQQEIPEFWRPMVRLIIPTHAAYDPAKHVWMSSYLPVYAALRAAFMSVGGEWLTNPLLAAASIFALAGLTRNLWPQDRWKPVVAGTLLAVSPQFLVMSMTGYAMPAHLAFNLFWLWLYSDEKKKRFWLAPFIGVAALGLHQPFFHALFVTPFLARLVLSRRWKASAWFAAVYLIGIACWYLWWKRFFPAFSNSNSESAFGLYQRTVLVQGMYLALLAGWLAFPVPLLALLGFSQLRKLPPLLLDAAASCILTFGFYIFVRLDQAHGWGDRYFYGALGCLILIAVAGWDVLAEKIGRPAAATFVAFGAAAALFVQLPVRCFQAEDFVRPFASASAAFQSSNADVVAYEPRMAWYSADLRRNDPALEKRPIIVSFFTMKEEEATLLQKTFPRSRLISEDDLASFGLTTKRPAKAD